MKPYPCHDLSEASCVENLIKIGSVVSKMQPDKVKSRGRVYSEKYGIDYLAIIRQTICIIIPITEVIEIIERELAIAFLR